MRISVDFDLCESNAVCEMIAPESFRIDDNDYLEILDDQVSDANRALIERAVASCPRGAISIVE